MKASRGIGMGVVVLVVIIAAALFYLWSSLDALVAHVIEKYGSQTTQTSVRVLSVDIDLQSGAGSVNELKVGNPKGFSSPNAFTLGGITVKIDIESITKDPIIINEITVQSPYVVYEINKSGQSNIDALKKAIAQTTGSGKSAPKSEESGGPGVVIRKFVIDNGEIEARVAALGGEPLSAKLPRIQLNNIGQKEGGATPAQITGQVLNALINRVGPSVATLGVDKYLGKTLDEAKAMGSKVGQQVDDKVAETLDDAASKGKDSLKKLFGN